MMADLGFKNRGKFSTIQGYEHMLNHDENESV